MTQMIPANLPLYFRCLRVPVEWRSGRSYRTPFSSMGTGRKGKTVLMSSLRRVPDLEQKGDFLTVRQMRGYATEFDPWEKRTEFFGLKQGDTQALLSFLRSVGLFGGATVLSGADSGPAEDAVVRTTDGFVHEVRYLSEVRERTVWEFRRLIDASLKKQSEETGKYSDFQVRIVRKNGQPQVIFTTMTFLDALLLTLSIDLVKKAKVRKCARPDCGVTFSYTGAHKRKYCHWDCGHIESVRRQRRKAKKAEKPKVRRGK